MWYVMVSGPIGWGLRTRQTFSKAGAIARARREAARIAMLGKYLAIGKVPGMAEIVIRGDGSLLTARRKV